MCGFSLITICSCRTSKSWETCYRSTVHLNSVSITYWYSISIWLWVLKYNTYIMNIAVQCQLVSLLHKEIFSSLRGYKSTELTTFRPNFYEVVREAYKQSHWTMAHKPLHFSFWTCHSSVHKFGFWSTALGLTMAT